MNNLTSEIVLFVLIILIILKKYDSYKKTKNKYYEIASCIMYISFAIIFCSTIIPNISYNGKTFEIITQYGSGLNLKPFLVFKQTWYEVFKNNNISYFLINFLGNIIIFIPIGLLPAMLYKKSNFIKIFALSLGTSLLIETTQFFIGRGTDIDDLWLNTLGGLIGYIIFKMLKKSFVEKFQK